MKNRGLIYFVNGNNTHLVECIYSVITFRKYHKNIPVTLFTSFTSSPRLQQYFDNVVPINNQMSPFKQKVHAMIDSPYELTLYLDADTKVMGPLYEIWEFLEVYDLAMARENECDWTTKPFTFQQFRSEHFNTGVIGFHKNENTILFLKNWLASMTQTDDKALSQIYGDQNFCNDLLKREYASLEQKILELPNKIYNVRSWAYEQLSAEERKRVKVHHSHDLHWSLSEKIQRRFKKTFF